MTEPDSMPSPSVQPSFFCTAPCLATVIIISVKVSACLLQSDLELLEGGLQAYRPLPSWHHAGVWHRVDAQELFDEGAPES